MDPRKLFGDERFKRLCVYCGGQPSTRDHVPSKVLLEEPFPTDLPVVPACEGCNNGFSLDEQYLACLLECAITGSADPASARRDKVRRILGENPVLASRVAASRHTDEAGKTLWTAEMERVQKVVLKLARGHAAYEYSEPQLGEPKCLSCLPISMMSEGQLRSFEALPVERLWPEIGSRAFLNAVVVGNDVFTLEGTWQIIQEGRYRYSASHSDGIAVRMVLSEYLACTVSW